MDPPTLAKATATGSNSSRKEDSNSVGWEIGRVLPPPLDGDQEIDESPLFPDFDPPTPPFNAPDDDDDTNLEEPGSPFWIEDTDPIPSSSSSSNPLPVERDPTPETAMPDGRAPWDFEWNFWEAPEFNADEPNSIDWSNAGPLPEPRPPTPEPPYVPAIRPGQKIFLETLLPDLLYEIFDLLDYWDLKVRVPLVCKYFHGMLSKQSATSHSFIDRKLFRDTPVPFIYAATKENPKPYRLHPAFEVMGYRYTETVEDVTVRECYKADTGRVGFSYTRYTDGVARAVRLGEETDGRELLKLSDSPLANEHAVAPAVSKCILHFLVEKGEKPLTIYGTGKYGNAVTVLDVMKGFVDIVKVSENKAYFKHSLWDDIEKCEVRDGEVHLEDVDHAPH